ncbi:hypothetical protein VP01_130g11 [Puccinia sorghi]|uniref:Uncharacterized protein n=1 Tax=Puccinia sorghi TaxID=27349 RepID=A0A0L6VMZ6_9BASI|nr:hypothetical protein VP01_130g11 [Puccinia sorghi]
MESTPSTFPSRRGSTGSLPTVGRRFSGGSAKTVRWIGSKLKNLTQDDDSDSDELWGTSFERPMDLEDPSCPVGSVPSGYVPLYQLVQRAQPEPLQKHWHNAISFSQGSKKGSKKSTKPDLKTLFSPSTSNGGRSGIQRTHSLDACSETPVSLPPSRPPTRVEHLRTVASRDQASSSSSPASPMPSNTHSKIGLPPRGHYPTWSQSRISRPYRRPGGSRWQEIYEPPK